MSNNGIVGAKRKPSGVVSVGSKKQQLEPQSVQNDNNDNNVDMQQDYNSEANNKTDAEANNQTDYIDTNDINIHFDNATDATKMEVYDSKANFKPDATKMDQEDATETEIEGYKIPILSAEQIKERREKILRNSKRIGPQPSQETLNKWYANLYDHIRTLSDTEDYSFNDLETNIKEEIQKLRIPPGYINSYSVLKNWYIDQKYPKDKEDKKDKKGKKGKKGKKNRSSKILSTIAEKIAEDNKSNMSDVNTVTSTSSKNTMVIPNSIGNLVLQEFYPLDTLCVLNDDLNYALRRSFEERIDNKIDGTNPDKIGEILFPTSSEKTLRQEIDYAIRNCKDQIENANAIVDACDIIHDVGYITELDYNGKKITSKYIESLSYIFKGETEKIFNTMVDKIMTTPSNLQQIVNNYKEGALSDVIKCIQNSTSFPQISYTPLSLAEGYFEIICNEMRMDKGLFRESGRKATLNKDKLDKIIEQYEGDFWEDCRDWCNNYFTYEDKEQLLKEHNALPTAQDYKTLYKNFLPCTTIDGSGTTNKDEHPHDYHEYQFDKTFGHYTYKVFTKYIKEQVYPWKHIVIVYKDGDLDNPIAIFSLAQNATIDLLLTSLGMPAARGGDGGKGAVQELDTTIGMFTDPKIRTEYDKLLLTPPPTEDITINATCWGKIIKEEEKNKELIALGIKTLGDKVMREYNNKNPNVSEQDPSPASPSASSSAPPPAAPPASSSTPHSALPSAPDFQSSSTPPSDKRLASSSAQSKGFRELTNVITTDKGIVFSNILDFIQSGNNNLAGVLRSAGNGWIFTKGQSEINRDEKIKQFRRKFTSYYFFIKSFGNEAEKSKMKVIKNHLGIEFKTDTNIERFEGIRNLHEIYKDVKKNKLLPDTTYEYIMGKLLEYEDEYRQRKINQIKNEIGQLNTSNYSNLLLTFSNLPDLKTHFISSVSVFTENNSSIYNLFIDGFSSKENQQLEDNTKESPIKKLPPPSDSIDISLDNGKIIIKYKSGISKKENYHYAIFGTKNGPEKIDNIKFYKKIEEYYIETPITLDFLIQLKEANESESNPFYNKIKTLDDEKIDSLINELLVEGHKYAGLTEQPFKAYQDEFFKKLKEQTFGKMYTIEEEEEEGKMDDGKEGEEGEEKMDDGNTEDDNNTVMSGLTEDVYSQIAGKKKRVTRKKIQVKRKQRNTLRKSTIKPINKKTRGRRNKKKKRSVTFKL